MADIYVSSAHDFSAEVLHVRVTKAQAQANREHIVETASVLFRERGFDGVGVADLMAAAGFTHGGFYKHFGSKADLMSKPRPTALRARWSVPKWSMFKASSTLMCRKNIGTGGAAVAPWPLCAATQRVSLTK